MTPVNDDSPPNGPTSNVVPEGTLTILSDGVLGGSGERMETVYKEYRPKIEVLSRVSDARDELKKYTRNEVDDSDVAPIP